MDLNLVSQARGIKTSPEIQSLLMFIWPRQSSKALSWPVGGATYPRHSPYRCVASLKHAVVIEEERGIRVTSRSPLSRNNILFTGSDLLPDKTFCPPL